MEKRIVFRSTEQSPAVKGIIEKRLQKLDAFLEHERQPITIDVVIEPAKVHAHDRVEIKIHNPDFTIISDYEGPEMYAVLEKVLHSIIYQLHEKKRELVEKRQRG